MPVSDFPISLPACWLLTLCRAVPRRHGADQRVRSPSGSQDDRDILVRVVIKKDGRKAAYISQRNSSTDFPLLAVCAANLATSGSYPSEPDRQRQR